MKLWINSQEKEFAHGILLSTLLAQLGIKSDRVAVELNGEIASRTRWETIVLNEGDRLEIVHFVGGGAPGNGSPWEAPS
ncbi:MAG TPA: sulfur carrier protein ThiS [Terriglobales bacterium]|jgi:thiamine biosynthesis protein ThiS|nr:sulfur carrier protein ThiS [Terriglobales bacterium]